MEELQCKERVNLRGIVAISFDVVAHQRLDLMLLDIRTRQGARIQKNFLNVFGESLAIPNSKMVELVPAQEKTFEVKPSESMIDFR